jgi:predicted PurR-regulated permease PerM
VRPFNKVPPSPGIQHPLVWLGVVVATLVLVVLFKLILWISLPTVAALVIYYLCVPVVERLRRMGLTHGQAVGLLVLGAMAAAVVVLIVTLPWLSVEAVSIQRHAGLLLDRGTDLVSDLLGSLENRVPALAQAHLADRARARMAASSDHFLDHNLPRFFGFAASWLPGLLLIPCLTFFFLRDGPAFKRLLMRGVPNAFFEKAMLLFFRMDYQVHQYFRGMVTLTLLDTLTLGSGLWLLGRHFGPAAADLFGVGQALALGLACAVLAWLPILGSLAGCLLVLLVCATGAPHQPLLAIGTGILFILARLVDDFIYQPLTVGKSLNIRPFLAVLMIFIGGSIAGVAGLFLVLPVLGLCLVAGEVFEQVWFDEHLRARHARARALRRKSVTDSIRL